jgi:hypothetical protein
LTFNLNINILGYWHSTQYNAKSPNANIQTEQLQQAVATRSGRLQQNHGKAVATRVGNFSG